MATPRAPKTFSENLNLRIDAEGYLHYEWTVKADDEEGIPSHVKEQIAWILDDLLELKLDEDGE